MSHDLTIEAVRVALGLHEARARVSSTNIANANVAGATAVQGDFSAYEALLIDAAQASSRDGARLTARLSAMNAAGAPTSPVDASIQLDEQVADMVTAGVDHQALSEALSRHFGLMRLAVTGRN